MEEMPEFSFCDILGAYVCLHESCRIVVKHDNLRNHLHRRHRISQPTARREAARLLKAVEGKSPTAIAARYYENPLPNAGDKPLPALPLLPMFDVVKCPCCSLYFNGHKACKSHMRSTHATHDQFQNIMGSMRSQPLIKGQALFRGASRLFFPVTCGNSEGEKVQLILPILQSEERGTTQSDQLSLRDKSANLTCSILGIPEFLESQNLTLEKAYELSRIDKAIHGKIVAVLMEYIGHFADMQPQVPLPIIEGIRIRNGDRLASFSLSIRKQSKRRYAVVAARFLQLFARVGSSHELSKIPLDPNTRCISEALLQHVTDGTHVPLGLVHSFFREVLLHRPRASLGELLLIESLFKLLIAGYTCGIHMKRVRVGDSEDASHSAAALQYFCHLVALGEFFVSPIGFGARTSEDEQARFKRIKDLLGTETCSPAAYLRTVLLKTKRLSAGESPRIDFVPCPNHPFCGSVENIEVQMNSTKAGSLGYAVRILSTDVHKMLRVELMQNFAIPTEFMSTVLSFRDKLNEKEPGYFFGSGFEARRKLQSWSEEFARHLSKGSTPLIQKIDAESGGGYGPTPHACAWLRAVDSATLLLYVLVHLCGGGPPRVTEMVEAKFRNTAGSRRNLFIIKQRLAFIGSYSKNSQQAQRPKPIACFLDRDTSELLLIFVLFIKPIQCFFLQNSMLNVRATEDYLFCQSGEIVDDAVVCKAFAKALNTRGLPLNVSLYRQWRTGIAKAFLAEGKVMTNEKILFLQAGHTEATARNRYASGDFNVGELSLAMLEGFYEISTRWHSLIGTQNMEPQPGSNVIPSFCDLNEKGNNCGQIKKPKPIARSSNRISRRPDPESWTVSRSKKLKTFDTREQNHLEGTSQISLYNSILLSAKALVQIPEQEILMFKSEAQHAALVECALQTVVGGYNHAMILILPTGGGKTLCWAAPVLLEQQKSDASGKMPLITLLIVPLISLQQDMVRKCREYGLRCGSWDERFHAGVSVVICSIDVPFSNEYERYLVALSVQGRIARIVLDEAHLILLWRELRRFESLGSRLRPQHTRHVPIVCLSATLPNVMSIKLQEILQMDPSCVKLYRAPNSRPNISYQVRSISLRRSEDMIAYCSHLLGTELRGLKKSERIILFCLTIKDCMDLYKLFTRQNADNQCSLYHGSMTKEEKEINFKTWISRTSELPLAMIATSAFSCGIDYPHVRTVIHVGGSRTIVELAQESGRAGRDGAPSKNVVVYNAKYLETRTSRSNLDQQQYHDVSVYGNVGDVIGNNVRCRRAAIESFLNDMSRGPCSGEELKCDICESIEVFFISQETSITDGSNLSSDMDDVTSSRKRIPAGPFSLHQSQAAASLREESLPSLSASVSGNGLASLPSWHCRQIQRATLQTEEARWHATQISLAKCAVCLYKHKKVDRLFGHESCMRAICFRCMENNAAHQSKECRVTPRGDRKVKRCFFCGILQSEGLHGKQTFNRKGKCEWEVSKNLALLMWKDKAHRQDLERCIPELRECKTIQEVGLELCGSGRPGKEVRLAQAVGYLYSLFVICAK